MKYVDEFRDPARGRAMLESIARLADELGRGPENPIKFMEVCGGHTHSIFKFGLEGMLPDSIELVHGPGCPVCVLPVGRVDDAVAIATTPGVLFATFGDAIRVPGSKMSLQQAKAKGADVRTVYSAADALQLAKEHPDREVVFFGLGFETTTPAAALTVLQAEAEGVENFSIFSNHIVIIPALKALLDAEELDLDGFVGPGHVSMVIGIEPYAFIGETYGKPFVVSGFEPLDVLQSVHMLLVQMKEGRADVENQYARVVKNEGNAIAQLAVDRVFTTREHFEWRGLGSIDHSGLTLRREYAQYDAERKFETPALSIEDPKACQCGSVLKGAIKPWECKVFGTACTPETPIGACMVSSEGSCAAYYNYGRLSTLPQLTEEAS
ncbi:MAG: hydrogenase formation protein HypD [Myxococcota bacterium]